MEKILQIGSSNPAEMEDVLALILREGARRLLKEAVELELEDSGETPGSPDGGWRFGCCQERLPPDSGATHP